MSLTKTCFCSRLYILRNYLVVRRLTLYWYVNRLVSKAKYFLQAKFWNPFNFWAVCSFKKNPNNQSLQDLSNSESENVLFTSKSKNRTQEILLESNILSIRFLERVKILLKSNRTFAIRTFPKRYQFAWKYGGWFFVVLT